MQVGPHAFPQRQFVPPAEHWSSGQEPDEYEPEVQQPDDATVEPQTHCDEIVVGLFGQA